MRGSAQPGEKMMKWLVRGEEEVIQEVTSWRVRGRKTKHMKGVIE